MAALTSPEFTDETAAIAHLEASRWPDGVNCPHCGSVNVHRMAGKTANTALQTAMQGGKVSDKAAQGALGNSRGGIAAGEAARGVMQDYNAQAANMRMQNYANAQNQVLAAGQLGANLGLGTGAQASRDYMNQAGFSEQARQLQQQKYDLPFTEIGYMAGLAGGQPVGSKQTVPTSSNPFLSAAGGAATGFGIGGPVGAGIGAGVGLLGSFF